MELENILTDHAYCEQKAALTCISLIAHFPEREEMVEIVAPIVSEEWGHFRLVLAELKKRNLKLGRQRKDEYVNKLFAIERRDGNHNHRLLDKLLISAMIEARSCERFRLLSISLKDKELRRFYRMFMESEAGHYKVFSSLAKNYFGTAADLRWKEILFAETVIIKSLKPRGDRLH